MGPFDFALQTPYPPDSAAISAVCDLQEGRKDDSGVCVSRNETATAPVDRSGFRRGGSGRECVRLGKVLKVS